MRTPRGPGRRREDPLAVLERAYRLLEAADLAGAKEQAERALKLDPELTEARGCLAEVALARGDDDEAAEQLRLALEVDPENPEVLYALAELLVATDPEEARELAGQAADILEEELEEPGEEDQDDDLSEVRHLLVEVVLLLARCHLEAEDEPAARRALERLEDQVSWLLDDSGREDGRRALLEMASARLALGDVERSGSLARAAGEGDGRPAQHDRDSDDDEGPCPGCLADAYYGLGLALEEQDKHGEAVECLARVADLDRQEPRSPFGLSPQRFEELAGHALAELPQVLAEKIGHVPVVVADYPSSALIADGLDPRILGFFAGTPYHEQGSAALPRPTCIYLFQRNIERGCESPEEVEQEIRTTVLHEAGHYFGLSEDDLHERGLG
jgi:predicted Zn-dependent protease with MMP-like domain